MKTLIFAFVASLSFFFSPAFAQVSVSPVSTQDTGVTFFNLPYGTEAEETEFRMVKIRVSSIGKKQNIFINHGLKIIFPESYFLKGHKYFDFLILLDEGMNKIRIVCPDGKGKNKINARMYGKDFKLNLVDWGESNSYIYYEK